MFQNRTLNNIIIKIHVRALRLVYQNRNLFFSELPELDNAVTIHKSNLQVLVTEIFKVKKKLITWNNEASISLSRAIL